MAAGEWQTDGLHWMDKNIPSEDMSGTVKGTSIIMIICKVFGLLQDGVTEMQFPKRKMHVI